MPVWFEIVVVLQFVVVCVLLFSIYFLRHSASAGHPETNSKIDQLTTKLDQFAATSAQSTSSLRTELLTSQSAEFSNLRQEVVNSITQIGTQTRSTLDELRTSTNARLDKLTGDLATQQTSLKDSVDGTLSRLSRDIRDAVNELKKDINDRIKDMAEQTTALKQSAELQQTTLRQTVEQRLDKLNESNTKKLDEMRETVDEKLHKTLETRLTESFGLVTDQLSKVQTGLGEMKDLAVNVGDLKRVFNNVSTRGAVGELWLGKQLDEKLAPNQFVKNARIRPNSDERVDYAIRIPNKDGEPLLLPIDAKFPKEDWERLEDAAKIGDMHGVEAARKGLEARIRLEAKKIADKYIFPPVTVPFALMYFPSEGLFSEALRIPGLVDDLHLKYSVNLVAPTNFMAVLNSLQMGFKTLAIQEKTSEVWQILAATKVEFQNFGALMARVEKQVGTVQNTIKDVNSKTRTINRKLRGVEVLEMGPATVPAPLEIEAGDGLLLGSAADPEGVDGDEFDPDEDNQG